MSTRHNHTPGCLTVPGHNYYSGLEYLLVRVPLQNVRAALQQPISNDDRAEDTPTSQAEQKSNTGVTRAALP